MLHVEPYGTRLCIRVPHCLSVLYRFQPDALKLEHVLLHCYLCCCPPCMVASTSDFIIDIHMRLPQPSCHPLVLSSRVMMCSFGDTPDPRCTALTQNRGLDAQRPGPSNPLHLVPYVATLQPRLRSLLYWPVWWQLPGCPLSSAARPQYRTSAYAWLESGLFKASLLMSPIAMSLDTLTQVVVGQARMQCMQQGMQQLPCCPRSSPDVTYAAHDAASSQVFCMQPHCLLLDWE